MTTTWYIGLIISILGVIFTIICGLFIVLNIDAPNDELAPYALAMVPAMFCAWLGSLMGGPARR
jgi:hypothetical protein